MSAGANTEQRRARRAELRQFYGIKGDQPAAEGVPAKTGGVLDIGKLPCRFRLIPDAPGFDAVAYLDDLVEKASLSELMTTASKLSAGMSFVRSSLKVRYRKFARE